ncbi:hypothetical protein LY90DRAFT_388641 [Neocallimastix californiae]|uniref:TPR-like protein n=1 Tax=Neocallimastix californiae TaxID=1754190 RepID=A0A1Y2AVI4_9FUNG|nr:hypothetical protein LY90DRAFT_388641 [Neocallimastix californiae]|eukprot:ORY26542.1 hypothetical protein LY90DRAFT_388641 [Neocallimastix californiae]
MNNPLFNQLNRENNLKGSDSQLIFSHQSQTNNENSNNQLKSPTSDSLLYNNIQPASELFSNSAKEPEFSISTDNTNENQNLLNSFNMTSPITRNNLNTGQYPQQNQISGQNINNQNTQYLSVNSTPVSNQLNSNIKQENIFDTLAFNSTNNTNNNWPDYLTSQQPTQNQQQTINNYNTTNNISNIMDSYNNFDSNSNGNALNNNQMINSNFPNFYSQMNTNQNQNTFSPTPQNQMNLLQDYTQSQQQNTYNQNQTTMNDPLQMNIQQNINQPQEQNSMNYKQNTNYNANFADPEMFKSLPSLNQYNGNNNVISTNVNNSNTTNNILQNSMNDPLNVNNIMNTSTPPPRTNNVINNNMNMQSNNIQHPINNNILKQENRLSNNLYNKNADNSNNFQLNMERTNSGIMERSSSNQLQNTENPLSVKTNSFQTVNSIEVNSPRINSVVSIDTDKSSLLSPLPEIKPSSITWERLFSSLELPPSFLNCQTPPLPESSKISLDNWVDPDIFFLIPNSDSLIDYLKKHFPKDTVFNRGLPKVEENDKYPEGTGILITSQSWHALAILTKKQILSTPPTKVDTLMKLWYCHILALSKLGLIQIARAEIQKLGDFENDPKFQFESYPDIFLGLYGTFVSFEIRVLKVLLLSYLDDTKQSLNGIYVLLHETKKQINHLEKNIRVQDGNNVNTLWLRTWKSRYIQLQLIIASLLIKMKNVPSAIKVLKKVQKKYPKHPEILSAIGRLHIQIGNHNEAKKYFRLVENLIKDLKKSISNYNQPNTPLSLNTNTINVKQLHEIILMNRSYISIMDNLYDLATQSLLEVLSINPTHLVAANNLALCYLYQGQLKKAIETMENMISSGPALACSQESFIFNLSTMYDLTSNTFLHKKKLCLDRIVKYSKDGLAVSCLKLN